jgi:hypothetical protein
MGPRSRYATLTPPATDANPNHSTFFVRHLRVVRAADARAGHREDNGSETLPDARSLQRRGDRASLDVDDDDDDGEDVDVDEDDEGDEGDEKERTHGGDDDDSDDDAADSKSEEPDGTSWLHASSLLFLDSHARRS